MENDEEKVDNTQAANSMRPPTPPPRADKQIFTCYNINDSNNYNLNCDDSVDKTCYKQSNSLISKDNTLGKNGEIFKVSLTKMFL